MALLEKIKQREDIVRIVSTITLAAIAVRSFMKGKRGRGLLAAGGAVAVGATTSTLEPTALEIGHEVEPASETETTTEDGAVVCAICNEPIVVGESRRPNENDEIVHEACL